MHRVKAVKQGEIRVYHFNTLESVNRLVKKVSRLQNTQFESLLKYLSFPITVVYEPIYTDKLYRDTYYTYFSSKYFHVPRNCERIAVFLGKYTYEQLVCASSDECIGKLLQENFVGTVVLKPTMIEEAANCGSGRILINPYKIHLGKNSYLRTTEFKVSILGQEYMIDAFPLSGQDGETMSCSETCVWEVMEYFGTRYSDYRTVLPSDILRELNKLTEERVLPTSGLTYEQITNILKLFGFEPKLYSRESYLEQYDHVKRDWQEIYNASEEKIVHYKEIFHNYVESAIPMVIGIKGIGDEPHSIVCIGHGAIEYNRAEQSIQTSVFGNYRIANSSQFVSEYVIMDDNQAPYCIEKFDEFTAKKRKVAFFSVPLYKHIYLDAEGVSIIVDNFLDLLQKYLHFLIDLDHNSLLVKRIFLTTSRNYKRHKTRSTNSIQEKTFYAEATYPKFIWVCELADYSLWKECEEKSVVGEILLDATAASNAKLNSILGARFRKHAASRGINDSFATLINDLQNEHETWEYTSSYYNINLKKGGF